MWTMHDYLGYGDISGLSVSGHHACLPCVMSLKSRISKHLHKVVYEGHRKYFDKDNSMLRNVVEPKPKVWKAKDWYDHWMTCEPNKKKKIPRMKALNCFHTLPYWHHLLINHLLDPMHIFKNVACVIWEHITYRRDTHRQHRDLEVMHIKEHLWENNDGILPPAPWVLIKVEEEVVKQIIEGFCTPTSIVRSLKGCFTLDNDLSGLKAHD